MKRLTTTVLVTFALIAASFAHAQDVLRVPDVVYDKPNGQELRLDFVRPKGEGPFPVVFLVHGGAWRLGSRTEYKGMQTSLAEKGIATVAVQYRFAPEAKFPAQLEDIQNAAKFVVEHNERFRIDPKRVIWMGGSAGGHLSLLAGFAKSDLYTTRLIINVAGPTDLRNFKSLATGDDALKQVTGRDSSGIIEDLLGTADRNAEIYQQASPVEQVRADSPRVLTFHGDKDDIVPVTQAELLHAKLRELKVPEKLVIGKGGGHNFGAWEAGEQFKALLVVAQEIKNAVQ